jgi:hypothetical protein
MFWALPDLLGYICLLGFGSLFNGEPQVPTVTASLPPFADASSITHKPAISILCPPKPQGFWWLGSTSRELVFPNCRLRCSTFLPPCWAQKMTDLRVRWQAWLLSPLRGPAFTSESQKMELTDKFLSSSQIEIFKTAAVPPRESNMTDKRQSLCITLTGLATIALHLPKLLLLWYWASGSAFHAFLANFQRH